MRNYIETWTGTLDDGTEIAVDLVMEPYDGRIEAVSLRSREDAHDMWSAPIDLVES